MHRRNQLTRAPHPRVRVRSPSTTVPMSALVALILSGCVSRPDVQHKVVSGADPACLGQQPNFAACRAWIDSADGFYYKLPSSMVLLMPSDPKASASVDNLKVVSIPALTGDEPLRALAPKQGAMKRTYLAATYLPNTRILTKLGVQVADDRKGFVSALGAVAQAAAFTGLVGPADVALPIIVTPAQLAAAGTSSASVLCKTPQGEFRCGTFTVSPPAGDVILASTFFSSISDTFTSAVAMPACRPMSIRLSKDLFGKDVAFHTVVNDPAFVQIVHLPAKGSVALHTSCGFDITSEAPGTDSIWAVVAELGTQFKAFWEGGDQEQSVK